MNGEQSVIQFIRRIRLCSKGAEGTSTNQEVLTELRAGPDPSVQKAVRRSTAPIVQKAVRRSTLKAYLGHEFLVDPRKTRIVAIHCQHFSWQGDHAFERLQTVQQGI